MPFICPRCFNEVFKQSLRESLTKEWKHVKMSLLVILSSFKRGIWNWHENWPRKLTKKNKCLKSLFSVTHLSQFRKPWSQRPLVFWMIGCSRYRMSTLRIMYFNMFIQKLSSNLNWNYCTKRRCDFVVIPCWTKAGCVEVLLKCLFTIEC